MTCSTGTSETKARRLDRPRWRRPIGNRRLARSRDGSAYRRGIVDDAHRRGHERHRRDDDAGDGVLLALAFYGVRGAAEAGLGRVVPPPFYLLALALLFVLELADRAFEARGLASTIGITAAFGILVVLAIEGGAYLWERPGIALGGYADVAVLDVAVVVAALGYLVYLSATESSR